MELYYLLLWDIDTKSANAHYPNQSGPFTNRTEVERALTAALGTGKFRRGEIKEEEADSE